MSFRSRLVLAITSLFFLLLFIFAALSYLQLNKTVIEEFDKDLVSTSRHAFSGPFPDLISIGQLETLLVLQADRQNLPSYSFLLRNDDTGRIYASSNWPEQLEPSDLADDFTTPPDWQQIIEDRGNPDVMFQWPGRLSRRFGTSALPRDRDSTPETGDSRSPSGPMHMPQFHEEFTVYGARTVRQSNQGWRILESGIPGETIFLAVDISPLDERRAALWRSFLPALAVSFLIGALAVYLLSARVLRPVEHLMHEMEKVSASDLGTDINTADYDREFAQLAIAFNHMLHRLKESFNRSERFAAAAAHQLRTPLTILGAQLEEEIEKEDPHSERLPKLGELMEEVEHLRRIVDQLLLLSRAEAGHLVLSKKQVDLSGEVEGLVEDLQTVAPELRIQKSIQRGIEINADSALLIPAIYNIFSNAHKYNDRRRRVIIKLSADNGNAILRVMNSGRPIGESEASLIFKQFYRLNRSGDTGGLGLGLPLAREIVQAHGGELILLSSTNASTSFQLTLPLD